MSSNVSIPGQGNYSNQTNSVNALQNTNPAPAASFAQALQEQQSGFGNTVPSGSQDNLSVLEYILDAYIEEMMSTFGGNVMSTLSPSSTNLPLQGVGIDTQGAGVDATTSTASPSGEILGQSQLYTVATQAAQIAGVPTSWVDNLVKIAMNESSGNPTAVNQGLTGDGEHAIGLMQTEPSTFQAYAAPGHTDITNPLDNMIAAVHYIKSRYGDAAIALNKSLNGGY